MIEAAQIAKTNYRVSDFLLWQRSGTLELSPAFQRRSVWRPGAKSYFIDTVIRGLPVPLIFLRDLPSTTDTLEPRREVVDGQQRLRTLVSFIRPSLLPDLKKESDSFTILKSHSSEYAGKSFGQLPSEVRQSILDYQLSTHVFPSHTNDRQILQIFSRMNATGLKLTNQELRNAEWFGEFKSMSYELASERLDWWRKYRIFTEYDIARMQEVELVSELAALMLRGLGGRTKASIDQLYREYDMKFTERELVSRRMRRVFDQIEEQLRSWLGESVFRRKALFYSLFAAFYDRMYGLGSELTPRRPRVVPAEWIEHVRLAGDDIRERSAPQEVLISAARQTTHVRSRRVLFQYVRCRS